MPTGAVEVSLARGQYTYRSVQLFKTKQRERTVVLKLDRKGLDKSGRVPEVWWLSRRPAPGCVAAVEELSGKSEQLCVDEVKDGTASGRIDAVAFTAAYSADGALASLEVPGARFDRSNAPLPKRGAALSLTFKVKRSRMVAAPAVLPLVDGVKALEAVPEGALAADADPQASCLDLARAYVAKSPGAKVELGVVLEGRAALPHAWVRRGADVVDPSLAADDPLLRTRRYLAFPAEGAGALYLELAAGTRQVVEP